jgi:hypothetical protein
MEQRLFLEADSRCILREIPSLLWKPRVYFCVYKTTLLDCISPLLFFNIHNCIVLNIFTCSFLVIFIHNIKETADSCSLLFHLSLCFCVCLSVSVARCRRSPLSSIGFAAALSSDSVHTGGITLLFDGGFFYTVGYSLFPYALWMIL